MKPNDLVLVTGASGFIGGRVVEKLVQEHGARVRVLAPHFGHCSRVARFRVELRRGDLADPASLTAACEGVKTVFHLAYSGKSREANLTGARHLGEAALAAGVERFVHVSSVAVYGETAPGPLEESMPHSRISDDYSATKAAVEDALLALHREKKLPLVVLQPTVVYGPFGEPWTGRSIRQVKSGRLVLPAQGEGVCNAVYVDDVADACALAATRNDVIGQCFLISGPVAVTWAEFYRAFERMAGVTSVTPMDSEAVREAMRRANDEKSLPIALLAAVWRRPHIMRRLQAIPPVRWAFKAGGAMLPSATKANLRRRLDPPWEDPARKLAPGTPPLVLPDLFLWHLYASRTTVRIDKARRLLGYAPQFDLARGMALTAAWAEWAGLISGKSSFRHG